MVRVITIRDDVYVELNRLKRAKNMSFSEIIEYLIHEKESSKNNILEFAGALNDGEIDRKALETIKKGMREWKRSV